MMAKRNVLDPKVGREGHWVPDPSRERLLTYHTKREKGQSFSKVPWEKGIYVFFFTQEGKKAKL